MESKNQLLLTYFLLLALLLTALCNKAQQTVLVGTGTIGGGSVFAFDPSDQSVTLDHDFIAPSDPEYTSFIKYDGKLWGMTSRGGTYSQGTIFSIRPDGSDIGIVYSFDFSSGDGYFPSGSLSVVNGMLFGMTKSGGSNGQGTIFRVNPDGTDYQTLHSFNTTEGGQPEGSLLEYNGVFWGLTRIGGTSGVGTIFHINPDGTGFTKVHDFNTNGQFPYGGLMLSNGKLWGTTSGGGAVGGGAIFNLNTDGTGFQKVHDFQTDDGVTPYADLIESNSRIWGVTTAGGTLNNGSIFSIGTDGIGFTVEHYFSGTDGGQAFGSLVDVGGKIWGTTRFGGANNRGTVFAIETDGIGFTKVHDFDDGDGRYPMGGLTEFEDGIFGITSGGGNAFGDSGVIFKISTGASGFEKIYDFNYPNGNNPFKGLVQLEGRLWGTTTEGGEFGGGVLFSLNTQGDDLTVVHNFEAASGSSPYTVLTSFDAKLWGTTRVGGANGDGVIFWILPDGSSYTVVHDFEEANGRSPYGGLTSAQGKLWGTARNGGANNSAGIIYSIDGDGTGFTKHHDFERTSSGALPWGELVLANNKLWGVTNNGGAFSDGVIFSINADGTGFTTVHDFQYPQAANPNQGITHANGKIWGMTKAGGATNNGIIYSIDTDGTNYTEVHEFDSYGRPNGELVEFDGKLWGTTSQGGEENTGTIFSLNYEGTGYTKEVDLLGSAGFSYGALVPVFRKSEPNLSLSLSDKFYNDEPFTLSVSSLSTGAITYSSSNEEIVSVSSSTATISGIGEVTITASQAEDANYASAEISQTITVSPAAISVTAEPKTKIYGGEDPALTYLSDALVLGDEFSGALSRTNGEDVGDYAIEQGTLTAGENYTLSFTGSDLTITKRDVTATADNGSKTFSQSDPELTYCISTGSLAFEDDFSGALSRETGEDAGTYAINQNTLSLGSNYELGFVNGVFTIDPLSIDVTADAQSKTYGDSDPLFSYSSDPLLDGDSFTGSLSRESGENVGSYAIDIGTLDAGGNYALNLTVADLTINKKELTATADDVTITAGTSLPNFTVSYEGFAFEDNEADIDEDPTGGVDLTSTDVPGAYDIVLSGGSDNNYAFNYVTGTLSITDILGVVKNVYLNIHPNPVQSSFTIQFANNQSFNCLIVIDQQGRNVMAFTEKLESYDISGLSKGVYYLLVETGSSISYAGKLLKE